MKPLLVLFITFLISTIGFRLVFKSWRFILSGKIAMSVMLFFTGIAHFVFLAGMASIIPSMIPLRVELVYLTGVLEFLFGIGLLLPASSRLTGWVLIIFFIAILPANVYASIHHINYQTGAPDGPGLEYLWFRVPLQFLYIVWTYLFAVKDWSVAESKNVLTKSSS